MYLYLFLNLLLVVISFNISEGHWNDSVLTTTTVASGGAGDSSSNDNIFELCELLDKYGCSIQTIPVTLRTAIEISIFNYTLPYNPCEFNTINVSWIWSQIPDIETYLSFININDWDTVPCYIIIQEPLSSILNTLSIDKSYLIDYNYWFDEDNIYNNNAKCDIYNLTNSLNCNNQSNFTYDNQQSNTQCIYPFAESKHETPYLADVGLSHCAILCELADDMYKGDIDTLDTFTMTSVIFTLLFTIGYVINVLIEIDQSFGSFRKLINRFGDMPLTFDCPIFIASNMLGFGLCLLMPFVLGKDYFNCSSYDSNLLVEHIPDGNWSCGVLGYGIFIFLHAAFWYMGLLSFSVFRYLHNSEKPLFGIRKKWYHAGLWTVLLGLFTGSLVQDAYGNLPPLGVCGPTLSDPVKSWVYVLGPLVFVTCLFIFCTVGAIYYTLKHIKYERDVGSSKHIKKEMIHLSIRLIIYQIFVAVACIAFIYVTVKALIDFDRTLESYAEYLTCLTFASDPNNNSCKLGFTISNDVYYIEGVIIVLVSSASFALSCSTRRIQSWKNNSHKAKSFIESKIGSKVSNLKSRSSKTGSSNFSSKRAKLKARSIGDSTDIDRSNKTRDGSTKEGSTIMSSVDDTHIDPSVVSSNEKRKTSDMAGIKTDLRRLETLDSLNDKQRSGNVLPGFSAIQRVVSTSSGLASPQLTAQLSRSEELEKSDNSVNSMNSANSNNKKSVNGINRDNLDNVDNSINLHSASENEENLQQIVEMERVGNMLALEIPDNNNTIANGASGGANNASGVATPATPVTPLSRASKEASFNDAYDSQNQSGKE